MLTRTLKKDLVDFAISKFYSGKVKVHFFPFCSA